MANGDNEKAQEQAGKPAAAQSAPASKPADSAPTEPFIERYTVDGWKERARTRFQDSPHAIAGALHESTPGQLFSEDEVKTALTAFHETEHEYGVAP